MKILVTGASGFVGQALTWDLVAAGHSVRAASRGATTMLQNTNIERYRSILTELELRK